MESAVVAIHVPPIKGTAQVKFKVLDGTEPTLSMAVFVADGNKSASRGEHARLITAKGETAPLTCIENDWFLKVLINDSNEFIRIDLWTPSHVCPPSWFRARRWKQREQHGFVRNDNDRLEGHWDRHQAEGQFEPRTNWCRRQNPATHRCWKTLRSRC